MSKFDIDKQLVQKLADLLEETNLNEIEFAQGEQRIRVVKGGNQTITQVSQPITSTPASNNQTTNTSKPETSSGETVNAPMVGTVYLAPEPGASPFTVVGSPVKEGDTILIIEAMKVMNQIKAPKAGTLTKLLVENEEPVEFGQPICVIE